MSPQGMTALSSKRACRHEAVEIRVTHENGEIRSLMYVQKGVQSLGPHKGPVLFQVRRQTPQDNRFAELSLMQSRL